MYGICAEDVPGLGLMAPMGWWFCVYLNSHSQRTEDGLQLPFSYSDLSVHTVAPRVRL